jgi:hypothetical protein
LDAIEGEERRTETDFALTDNAGNIAATPGAAPTPFARDDGGVLSREAGEALKKEGRWLVGPGRKAEP